MTRTKRRVLVRDHGRGTPVLDRSFPGVGRIKRASGTTEPKMVALLDSMLQTLYKGGRLDLLTAIREGTLTPLEVWSHFRVGSLDQLPAPETLKPFRETALAWAEQYKGRRGQGIHERHRYELSAKLSRLADLGAKDATVADSPRLLRHYREQCLEAGTHRTFNYARAALQAFLRNTVGRRSAVYVEVADIEPLDVRRAYPRPAMTPAEARAWRDKLGPEAGAIWWSMCCTGMGPTEFWGRWAIEDGATVLILGTKREGRRRRVPLVTPLRRPEPMTYGTYRKRLSQVSGGALTPYDARRTYMHWLEEAGVPRTRRRVYMGHAIGDTSEIYERHEFGRYLQEDRERLIRFIGTEASVRLRVVK